MNEIHQNINNFHYMSISLSCSCSFLCRKSTIHFPKGPIYHTQFLLIRQKLCKKETRKFFLTFLEQIGFYLNCNGITRLKMLLLSEPRVRLPEFLSFTTASGWNKATWDEAEPIISFSTVYCFLDTANIVSRTYRIYITFVVQQATALAKKRMSTLRKSIRYISNPFILTWKRPTFISSTDKNIHVRKYKHTSIIQCLIQPLLLHHGVSIRYVLLRQMHFMQSKDFNIFYSTSENQLC